MKTLFGKIWKRILKKKKKKIDSPSESWLTRGSAKKSLNQLKKKTITDYFTKSDAAPTMKENKSKGILKDNNQNPQKNKKTSSSLLEDISGNKLNTTPKLQKKLSESEEYIQELIQSEKKKKETANDQVKTKKRFEKSQESTSKFFR